MLALSSNTSWLDWLLSAPPEEAEAAIRSLDPDQVAELERQLSLEVETLSASQAAEVHRWRPFPGPQTLAYQSSADVLLYGGAAGGGKTDLALGKALTQHRRTLILRREYPQLAGIFERAQEIYGPFGRYNTQHKLWRCAFDGVPRMIEFGSCQFDHDKTKYQGRPHDLLVFDEAANFLESQVRFIAAWLRTEYPGQRCQLLLPSNPPTGAEGDWLFAWFAAWLDEKHPRPARPGELRWFAFVDNRDVEVAGPEPFTHKGELIRPQSRTFVPARVSDNPVYMRTGYVAQLQALPEPLRSKMLQGDFAAGREDDAYQVIPTEWVRLAQKRWEQRARPTTPMSSLGLDVARGGIDATVLSPRFDNWLDKQTKYPGTATPDGPKTAALALTHQKNNAPIQVDVIGVGAAVYDSLRMQPEEPGRPKLRVVALNGAEKSEKRDRTEQLGFVNKRAQWWWQMREALDPTTGEDVALPPDPELLADLTAPRWKLTVRGIQVESKDDIIARIGRSPDKGDSAVYAFAQPDKPPSFSGLDDEDRPHWQTRM